CVRKDRKLLKITTCGLSEEIYERVLEITPFNVPPESTVGNPGHSPEFNRPEYLGAENRCYRCFSANGDISAPAQAIRWRIRCNRLGDHPADEADPIDIGNLAFHADKPRFRQD